MIDAKVTIDASAAQRLLDTLENLPKQDIAESVADVNVMPLIQQYPPQSGKKMQWKSEKQRRFVMAAINRGEIEVPYRRTGDYGGSFQKQPIGDGVALASQLPYAPYVRGPVPDQAAYHKGNWDTLDQIAEKVEGDPATETTVTAAILKAVGDAAE